ncbi:MAG: DNA primase, partial [Gelidibacter sp.]|nr:DNA primase [Gelidibacter sp.]
MDISEDVLFSTLAQINKKESQEANKNYKAEQQTLHVVKAEKPTKKINHQYELERKIIEILLLYGNETEKFEDLVLKEDEVTGDLKLEPVVHEAKVFEKIYLDLQEDEMQFSDEKFKILYYTIIDTLHQAEAFQLRDFISKLDQSMENEVTTILMNDERYRLHDWERNHIIPKEKKATVSQLVTQTILSLRCFLIDQKVVEYQVETSKPEVNTLPIMEDIRDYLRLKTLLSKKLGKVVGSKI